MLLFRNGMEPDGVFAVEDTRFLLGGPGLVVSRSPVVGCSYNLGLCPSQVTVKSGFLDKTPRPNRAQYFTLNLSCFLRWGLVGVITPFTFHAPICYINPTSSHPPPSNPSSTFPLLRHPTPPFRGLLCHTHPYSLPAHL